MPKKKHILITKQIFFANKNILFYFYFVIYLARGHAPGTSETPVAAGFTFPPRARPGLPMAAWHTPGKPKGAGPSTDPAPCVLKWLWSKVSLSSSPGASITSNAPCSDMYTLLPEKAYPTSEPSECPTGPVPLRCCLDYLLWSP